MPCWESNGVLETVEVAVALNGEQNAHRNLPEPQVSLRYGNQRTSRYINRIDRLISIMLLHVHLVLVGLKALIPYLWETSCCLGFCYCHEICTETMHNMNCKCKRVI